MPHIKEVLSSEVHWQLAGWNVRDQANARIKMLLGNDAALFAPVYVTHGGYYWSTPDTAGWRLLSDADEATAAAVRRRIEALRASVEARFPAQAEKIRLIFTVPNDDFIFFKSNGTAVPEILISGWGFANFNRARGGQPIRDVEENTLREVTLSFNIDGERQPERSFEFLKPTGWVSAATNAEGIYSFGMQNPGETISVRDGLTGIEQNLLIGPDTRHFDVDVTEFLTLRVNGTCDGNPIEGERAVFHYGHRAGEAVLEQGRADFRLPWLRDCGCTVKLRDQEQTRVLDKDSVNVFNFEFLTPQPTRTRVEVYVSANGRPIANEPVRITHESTVRDLMTDANGLAVTEFEIAPGAMVFNPVSALVRDASASEQLAFEPVRFNFDFSTPPKLSSKVKFWL